jgi:tetratricopeptide (TPR) repeat protein
MVRLCKERDIPLILSTLPVNLKDISPFKSEHSDLLDRDSLSRWQQFFTKGLTSMEVNQPAQALNAFSEATYIDDDYALLDYRKGQAYEQFGNLSKAYEAYDLARQKDIVPLRALNEFNQAIRSTALSSEVALADVEKFYLRISPGNLPGNNLFVDHVHPSIEGQQLIAWVVLNAATEANLLPLDAMTWQKSMPKARDFLRQELGNISERYQAMGLYGVGRLYFWAGKYPEAYVALQQAWQSVQDVAEMARQLGELELLRGDTEKALEYLDAAERLEPGHFKVLLARAVAMNNSGRAQEAMDLLLRSEVPEEKSSALNYTLGLTLRALDRSEDAVGYFSKAVTDEPKIAAYRLELAEALKQAGQKQEALNAYRNYLGLIANPALAEPAEQWLEAP